MGAISALLAEVQTALVGVAQEAPVGVDVRTIPSAGLDGAMYTIDLQTVEGGERQASALHLVHALTISLRVRVRPREGVSSLGTLATAEEAVLEALLVQQRFPEEDVRYVRTDRKLDPSGEWLQADVRFAVQQFVEITS